MRRLLGLLANCVVIVGCGGSTVGNGADESSASGGGGGGGSSSGGSASGSGGSATVGATNATTVGATNATTVGATNTSASSGGPATTHDPTGSGGSGTATTSGGLNCFAVSCDVPPPCGHGVLLVPAGECCPVCACTGALCVAVTCDGGAEPIYEPGNCCPTCPAPSCAGVQCEPLSPCAEGYAYGKAPGACCAGCLPDPNGVLCAEIICREPMCPAGYVSGEVQGACCDDCVPDPLYCNTDADCTIADKPRSCCGCPEAVSTRLLADDPCWFAIDTPRDLPSECYPDAICDAFCGACPAPGVASCVDHRCTELLFPL